MRADTIIQAETGARIVFSNQDEYFPDNVSTHDDETRGAGAYLDDDINDINEDEFRSELVHSGARCHDGDDGEDLLIEMRLAKWDEWGALPTTKRFRTTSPPPASLQLRLHVLCKSFGDLGSK